MKGYNTSKDYDLLWEFIQQGYRVPGWVIEEKALKSADIYIHGKHVYISRRIVSWNWPGDKNVFIQTCINLDLQFILPITE